MATLAEMKADIARLTRDLTPLYEKMESGKPLTQSEGEDAEAKAKECERLQAEIDKTERIAGIVAKGREIPDQPLPGGPEAADQKGDADKIVGYVSVGDLVTSSDAYRAWVKAGGPRAGHGSQPIELPGFTLAGGRKSTRLVPVTREQAKAVTNALRESKAVATLGTGVIDAQRLADVVRVTEQDALRIRDVMNVSQTNSNAVEYLRMTSYTRAAAPVADGAAKPEATAAFDVETATVRTIAVWMPATEQMLMDAPQIRNAIDTELLYDLDKVVEEQIMYGSGAGQNFAGITNDTDVAAVRVVADDTNLDKIRRAITDIRRNGYSPNAVVIDPIDWEGIELLKGTDDRYVWAVVRDELGPRVWGLRVVETIAAEENAGNTTEERNIVVGDWVRGATLWDRQQATVAVGWKDDDFIKNLRTIRAELRAAFAVRRPKAFIKITSQAAVA
jgi:HK97 family phage major capsid protein